METLKDCHDALKCHHAERVFFRSFSLSILHVKKGGNMAELTNEQKKAWAKTLYTRETLTQAEIIWYFAGF